MEATTYKCPGCGAALSYDGASGMLACASCASTYSLDEIEGMSGANETNIGFEVTAGGYEEGEIQAYVCQSCGAELLTEETTTATECPYCGSPIVLNTRIEEGVRPEKVVPFVVTKEEATNLFETYFKGKALMPNVFLNTRNRIAEMRKLYVPYWLFGCDVHADAVYDCERTSVERQGNWEIRRTRHYIARRGGSMRFDAIPVDGSVKLDNRITESLEPYDTSRAVEFDPAVLSGAMADRADVEASQCEERAIERVKASASQKLRSTVAGYTAVHERHFGAVSQNGTATPVLMPVWLITTEKEEKGEKKTYTFAVNGQTGKLTCDVPADAGKSFAWGGSVFAGMMAICLLVMYLTGYMDGFMIFMAAIVALIIALIVVGALSAQLKTAVHQSAAGNYLLEETFGLHIRSDRFTHETVQRRQIEQKQN